MGGFMKNIGSNLGRAVIFSAFLLAFPALRASAQSQPAADSDAAQISQTPRVPARVTQAVDDSNRVTLRGNVHRLALPEFDRGAVSDAQPAAHVALVLKRSDEQESALEQLLQQQQDKSSPNYHKWLTPQQFGAQFGPADSDIQAVTDWLTARGFTNIAVGPGRTRVEFDGNVGQITSAFQTQIHHFMVNGKMHMANVSDPQIPAALSPVVRGVTTLNDFRPHALSHRLGTFRKTKDSGVVKPLFTFNGCGSSNTPAPCWAVGPGDFAKIYNSPATVNGVVPGTGVTIAIVQDSNINVADYTEFRAMFGLSAIGPPINVILNGPDPGIQGPNSQTDDEFEADLDTQMAGAVAPGAQIDLVVSQDSDSIGIFGIDLSAIYIVDNNIAPILSESFGDCESDLGSSGEAFYVSLWQQASAQGITAVLAAGDSGSASCDNNGTADTAVKGIAVSGLASTVYNVALGGTDFQNSGSTQNAPGTTSTFWNTANTTNGLFLQTSAKGYIPEWPWNDGCAAAATASNLTTCTNAIVNANSNPSAPSFGLDLIAGGGGPSTINTKPAYQSGINGMPPANFRQVPDISFFAGNGTNASFYIVCQQDSNPTAGSSCDLTNNNFTDFEGVGGTSAAAPAFAGVMAMVNQKTGQRQGNANFVLYQLYKNGSGTTICPSSASPASTCVFYDTVLGNNSVACQGGTPNCSNGTSGQFGVMIDPTKTNTPAFLTATGYDNATGLGSINITNLLNAWSSATFTADTVTLTGPSGTIPHGTVVPFTVTVNPTAATGTVALVAKPATGSCTPPLGAPTPCPQVGIGSFAQSDQTFTLSGGTAHISTDQLPGGSAYQVVANYAGDGTYAPGTSAPVTVTVSPEASATAVSFYTTDASGTPSQITASSIPYGGSYILQIAVSDSQNRQCATSVSASIPACPTGTITLTDNGAALKDFSGKNTTVLNSLGFAEDQFVNLSVGAHSLVAAYSGDNSYNASTSPAKAMTITTAATTVSITTAPASNITTATPVTLTAKINTQSLGAGPTGSVVFKANNTQIGNAVAVVSTPANLNTSANAFATATITQTFSTAGNVAITAAYTTGDTNYSSSTGSGNVTVTTTGTVPTTTVLTSSSTAITSGASVTLNAVVTGSTNNGPGVTGAVQFMNGTQALGSPVSCTSTAGTATTQGTCKATLSTALSNVPPGFLNPSRTPRVPPAVPFALVTCILALLLIVTMHRSGVPARRRLAYASAFALIMIGIAAGFAGCGGGSSGGGGGGGGGNPTSHVDSITAVYGGDSTYIGSTSTAVAVTVTTQ
jgi:Pro-kumamolisin, activation domain/Bacterial Ig-like domain (group 3)